MKRAVHWFRRDLRVSDNTALAEAVKRAELVFPVFVIEDAFHTGPDIGAARLAFLFQSLESLRKNLEHFGYPLIVSRGKSEIVLPKLCKELGAEAVFCNRRYEPYAQMRDNRVFNALNAEGIGFETFKDAVIWEERELLTKAGNPFTVFTPYSKAWKAKAVPAPRGQLRVIQKKYPKLACEPIPQDPADFGFPLSQSVPKAGEHAARDLLDDFVSRHLFGYAEGRNFPAQKATSQLSPHLRAGTIGIRTIIAKVNKAREKGTVAEHKSCDAFLNELIWRDFYLQVLVNFPHVMKGAFRPEYDALEWENNEEHFKAWCEGMTGYPIVDAAMRCLNKTGWMHNRLRMIVAMFLTKDLLINWQWGERYFMQKLVDGDMAANNGGWQWSAGTGTDAAPYFRIFNPVSQAQKCDPKGTFVRDWVPELDAVPDSMIHQPWLDSKSTQGRGYSTRTVIHEDRRRKCLAMFKAVKAKGDRHA